MIQGDVEEDEMIPDKEEDIRPIFYKSRSHHNQDDSKKSAGGHEDGEDEDDEDDNDLLGDESALSDWNLRK